MKKVLLFLLAPFLFAAHSYRCDQDDICTLTCIENASRFAARYVWAPHAFVNGKMYLMPCGSYTGCDLISEDVALCEVSRNDCDLWVDSASDNVSVEYAVETAVVCCDGTQYHPRGDGCWPCDDVSTCG